MAQSDLQPHYVNGVFGNVYLLALDNTKIGKHCRRPIAVVEVVDHLGQSPSQSAPTILALKNGVGWRT